LPPLTALRSFEAAARHASFTRAAKELSVTQTAISHQIKLLESHLGTKLFRRLPRQLLLTREGEAWAQELRAVFSRLHEANRRLRAPRLTERPLVSVSVIPSFGARWLVPRLGRFLQRHPDFDVRVSPTEHLVDFRTEPVDVGIRYGTGRYPGLLVEKLAADALVVVCAPALCAGRRGAASELLARHVLLHDDAPEAWARWLDAQGLAPAHAPRQTELTDSSMVVEAAVRGQGIALARWSLAMDDLGAGRLVLPFPRAKPLSTGLGYYLACPQTHLARPEVAAFRSWIRREARALGRQLPGPAIRE
jgi:LysR family glycine cleavage system transcriptional activator